MLETLNSGETEVSIPKSNITKPYTPPEFDFTHQEKELKDKNEAEEILKKLKNESNDNKQGEILGNINKFLYPWGIEEIIKPENKIGQINQFTEEEKEGIVEARNLIEFDLYYAFETINNFDDNDIKFLKNMVDSKITIEINGENIKFDDFLKKLKSGEIQHPILKSCSRDDDVYANKNDTNYDRKDFPGHWRQKINKLIIEDRTNEINNLKDKLLTKDNMTKTDKNNMQICIDFVLGGSSGPIVENGHHEKMLEQLMKLDEIKYGTNYIDIGGIKYNKEAVIKDIQGNPKLITGEEYLEALKQQNKKGIKTEDILKSVSVLPEKTMLGILLGAWDEGTVSQSSGKDQNVIRGIIGTTDFENKGDIKEYKGYCMTIDKGEENMCASIGPSGEDPISTVHKFFGLSKED